MVARTYVQNNPEDHQVDQLISLGSPHHGAPQVYYLWEGADLNETFGQAWQRIGVGILIQLKKQGFENNIETVQHTVPGLKNLLPDFPYLEKRGSPKPLDEMGQRNLWLENINTLPLPDYLVTKLTTVLGRKGDTLRWIKIRPRSWFDKLLGRWEDGKPTSEKFEIGDKSVLIESGQLEGATVEEISGLSHNDLVESEDGQEKIMDLLGLSPSEYIEITQTSYEPSLVFQLASPANFTIFGPGGWQIGEGTSNNIPGGIYSPEDKLIIIPNPLEGDYEVQVTGENGGGDYRLLFGNINQEADIWREEGGQIGEGETKTHQVSYTPDPEENRLALLQLANKPLQEAKVKASQCKYPFSKFLKKSIRVRIRQINKIISLIENGKDNKAKRELKWAIISLKMLEKNMKFWGKVCPEIETELKFLLREARDYLIQARESYNN